METTCNLSKCAFYSILTAIGIIVLVILVDVILYSLYSYYYVNKYYADDLKELMKKQLKKHTHIAPGQPGSSWSEFHPPVDQTLNYIDGNDEWLWGLTKKNTYVCRKPCNGKTDDHIWRNLNNKVKLSEISVGNNYVWGASNRAYYTDKPDGTGKLVKSKNKFRSVSIGHSGWTWAIGKNSPYKCAQKNMCTGLKKDKWIKSKRISSFKISVGNNYVWSIDKSGNLFKSKADGSDEWKTINTDNKPGTLISIAAGKDDTLYAVNVNNKLFKGSLLNDDLLKWTEIEDSPEFKSIKVSNAILGIDTDNKLWIAPLEKF